VQIAGRPQHIAGGQSAHVVVGDVGNEVIGSSEVQRVRGYRCVPMICPELQSKACVFEAYAGAAEPAVVRTWRVP
jgi:hypothetical protein